MKVAGIDRYFSALAFLTLILLYAGITPSFSSDDYVHLLKNTKFSNLSEALVVFTEPYGREYRPLVRFSLWLNSLADDTAISFKITNLVLHLLSTLFIYRIFTNLQFSKLACIIGTAVFAFHPIHITSIHFILGRTDLIAAVFYFGTLVLVTKWKNTISPIQYIGAGLGLLAALLSKEMSVSLPLMMVVIYFYYQADKNFSSFKKTLLKLSPFFALTAGYVMLRIYMWSEIASTVDVYTNYSVKHIITNYAAWLFALNYPFDLYLAQEWMIENPTFFFAIAAALVFIAAGILGISFYRYRLICEKPFWLWAGLIWIAITLLPISGGYAHRWYLYIPSFGIAMLIGTLIESNRKNIMLLLSIPLLFSYAVEDIRLSSIWKMQSEINESFLSEIKEKQIYTKEEIYFANVPFGYKSAYLFTHNSLQEAIEYHFGKAPKVIVLTYVNIDDDTDIKVSLKNEEIKFGMKPNHYRFFLLTANERRFEKELTVNKYETSIKIESVGKNKKIAEYSIIVNEKMKDNFYYYDGKKIASVF